MELRNVLKPEFYTGGESLATALRSSQCLIRHLVGDKAVLNLFYCLFLTSVTVVVLLVLPSGRLLELLAIVGGCHFCALSITPAAVS